MIIALVYPSTCDNLHVQDHNVKQNQSTYT